MGWAVGAGDVVAGSPPVTSVEDVVPMTNVGSPMAGDTASMAVWSLKP